MPPLPSPEDVKRRIFLVLLPIAGVASIGFAVHGLVTARVAPWAAWTGGATGIAMFAFVGAFLRYRDRSALIELALVIASAGVMAGVLLAGAMQHDELTASFELIRQGLWLPAIYGVGFVVLPPRAGATLAWGLWALLALSASSHIRDPSGHGPGEITTMVETLVAHAVLIFVMTGVASVIRANERRAAGLEVAANTDELTRIANRRSGERRLEDEVERSIRYDRPMSVVLFDLDLFKRINDTLGHEVGDRVLQQVPAALASRSRESDLLVRWGGEEFLVIAPEMRLEAATTMAERFRALIEQHDFGIGWAVTSSFGVAERVGTESGADVVRRADEAMYAAKRHGRNAVWRSQVGEDGVARIDHVTSGAPTRTSDRLPAVTITPTQAHAVGGGGATRSDAEEDDAEGDDAHLLR